MRKIYATDTDGRKHIAGEGEDETGRFVFREGKKVAWSGYFARNQTFSFFRDGNAWKIDVHWDGCRFSAVCQAGP